MAGERPELSGQRAASAAWRTGRAAIGKTARRTVSWITASATGGTTKGAEVGVRFFVRSLPLLGALAVIALLAVIGAIAGFTAANASSSGSCSTGVGGSQAPRSGNVSGSPQQRFAELKPVYAAAATQFQLGSTGWAYLAAINNVETDFGLDMAVSSKGAIGWMQFEPSTFVMYAVPVTGVNTTSGPDPYNPYDAIYAAANMLHADGAPGDWAAAIFAYNHAEWYVQEVTSLAQSYAQGGNPAGSAAAVGSSSAGCASPGIACGTGTVETTPGPTAVITSSGMALAPASAPPAVQKAIWAGNCIIDTYYSKERNAGMLTTVMSSYDCSGSTDFVLYNAGLSSPQVDIGNGVAGDSSHLESYGQNGAGPWITVYANPIHAFIDVAGIVLDTAWYASVQPSSPSSGPRWQPASIIPAQKHGDKLGWFTERHPPGL